MKRNILTFLLILTQSSFGQYNYFIDKSSDFFEKAKYIITSGSDNARLLAEIIKGDCVSEEIIQIRGRKGQELYYLPNSNSPYTGWMIGKDNAYNNQITPLIKEIESQLGQRVYHREIESALTRVCKIIDGQKDGLEIRFDPKMLVLSKINWSKGKIHGKQNEWFPDGNFKLECNFKNGLLDGDYRAAIDVFSDVALVKANWSNGKIHGKLIREYKSSQIARIENYENGVQTGLQQYWTKNGVKYKIEYKNNNGYTLVETSFFEDSGEVKQILCNYSEDKRKRYKVTFGDEDRKIQSVEAWLYSGLACDKSGINAKGSGRLVKYNQDGSVDEIVTINNGRLFFIDPKINSLVTTQRLYDEFASVIPDLIRAPGLKTPNTLSTNKFAIAPLLISAGSQGSQVAKLINISAEKRMLRINQCLKDLQVGEITTDFSSNLIIKEIDFRFGERRTNFHKDTIFNVKNLHEDQREKNDLPSFLIKEQLFPRYEIVGSKVYVSYQYIIEAITLDLKSPSFGQCIASQHKHFIDELSINDFSEYPKIEDSEELHSTNLGMDGLESDPRSLTSKTTGPKEEILVNVLDLVKRYFLYLQNEDIDGLLSTMHSGNTARSEIDNELKMYFSSYDIAYELKSKEVVEVDQNKVLMRIEVIMRKIKGPANEEDNPNTALATALFEFRKESGEWKIFAENEENSKPI